MVKIIKCIKDKQAWEYTNSKSNLICKINTHKAQMLEKST